MVIPFQFLVDEVENNAADRMPHDKRRHPRTVGLQSQQEYLQHHSQVFCDLPKCRLVGPGQFCCLRRRPASILRYERLLQF